MLSTSSRVQANWFGLTRSSEFREISLRELRIEKGFESSKSFALSIGMKVTTYQQIESTGRVGKENRQLIADGLGLPVEEVFPSCREKEPVELTIIRKPVAEIEAYLKKKYGNKLAPCCSG